MSAKTIFIIIVTILVTIILMENTEEVDFWLFGEARISKLAILGVFFGLGLIIGFILGRPKKKVALNDYSKEEDEEIVVEDRKRELTDEDRDYIN